VTAVKRMALAFGRFWKDFLIGDSPEIFIGVLVILAVVVPLRHHGLLAGTLLLVLVTLLLVASLFRAARARG
jgi:ABC-type phosphate transport system permease subunit